MRALNHEEQEHRKRKVLQYVIHEFIRTGKPVGSHSIASASRLGLSSATIRNILAELEREDMITHPHTSAGRLPTDKGYRVYVDSLIELQRLAVQEQAKIQNEYERKMGEIEDLMSQTSRMLSNLSRYTGFVMSPKLEQNIFSALELVPISDSRILVAMITTSGLAKHFVINTKIQIPRDKLRGIARIINQNFQGCTLQEVKSRMMEKLENAQQEYHEIMSLVNEIGEEIKKLSSTSEIYLDGASNILSLPDFSKTEEVHDLFKIIEEKQILSNLLESELARGEGFFSGQDPDRKGKKEKPGDPKRRIQVRIGSENPIKALQNLSVVTSTYRLGDKDIGVLGILGPKRMEYPKMMALVDYVSQMVDRILKEYNQK